MATTQKQQQQQQEIWYVYISGETRGPISIRDLDVLLRTNQINSRTLGWRNGMPQWKSLNEIEQIKENILQSSKQIIQIEKKRQQLFDNKVHNKPQQQEEININDTIENKDQNALTILQTTVDNLIKKTFHQGQDGQWNIFNQQKGQWTKQSQQPTEQIQSLKDKLFQKLKNQLFFSDKHQNRWKKNDQKKNQQQAQLTQEQLQRRQRNKKKTKRANQKKKEKWYKSRINTFVYISGLPFDLTDEQLKEFVTKAGVLRVDLQTGQEKMKIYKDQDGISKGDAAVSYARQQSVQLALQNLNGTQIRSGFPVTVQKATFAQKDMQYKPRQGKKQTKVNKILEKKNLNKKFTWNEEQQEGGQGLKIVILKYIFTPQIADNDSEIDIIKKQMTTEMANIGQIHRIKFYQTHPEGVVEVKFKKDKDAQQCIHIMNGRYYDGRQVVCEYWDGETDYKRNNIYDILRAEQFGQQLEQINEEQEQQQNHQEKKQRNGDQNEKNGSNKKQNDKQES